MTDEEIASAVATYDRESITIRGNNLSSDIIGELDLGQAAYLTITGERPTDGEGRLLNAMLTALISHGMTSHVVCSRLTYSSAPRSVQGAVASGLLGVGENSAGAPRQCASELKRLEEAPDTDVAIRKLVDESETKEPFGVAGFAGIGHSWFGSTDPRAEKILSISDETGIAGTYTDILRTIHEAFEAEAENPLPINVVGALSASALDLGLSPAAAQGAAIISRTVGLVAEIEAEIESPQAHAIEETISENIRYTGDDA